MDRLFVYGSLKRGFVNYFALQLHVEATFVCEGKMPGILLDLGTYPAVVSQPNSSSYVYGEIFDLGARSAQLLTDLDYYEDYDPKAPHLGDYRREMIAIETGPDKHLNCWCYVYNRPWQELSRVPGGNWIK